MTDTDHHSIVNEGDCLTERVVPMRDGEINSLELFKFEKEVRIRHGEQLYRLRLTSLNKLILTK